ncbi:MAG: hypothetical protein ACLURV_06020 [Gallintestinimicrobium sp.]
MTDGQVKIGEETVLLADLPDQEVTVGIRPEGFVVDEDGTFSCALKGIEVLGRDISIVASHPAAENASIRAIVGSTRLNQDMAQAVSFSLKTDKVFLFDAKDGSRIETALKRPAGKGADHEKTNPQGMAVFAACHFISGIFPRLSSDRRVCLFDGGGL